MDGLWKLIKEEWGKVTPEMVRNVMGSWKLRCRTIHQRNGEHVEQAKKLHQRLI
jgi:hypothetical protein